MTKRVTLQDVAKAAGVSITTVSRVINSGPNVRPGVQERVQHAVATLGYQPNAVARSLRSGRDTTIGVVVDSLADIFFATFVNAIEEVAAPRGLAVTIASSGRQQDRERGLVERFLQRQVAGLILVPVAANPRYLPSLRRGTPVVFADRLVDIPEVDAVVGDDYPDALAATRHLLAHGHRRIAYLGDAEVIHTSAARLAGYRDALAEAGVPELAPLVITGCSEPEEAKEATRELLGRPDGPTAIFSSNLRCTIGAVTVLHAEQRTDVAVVGFGDFPLAGALAPAITVVDQDPGRMGTLCAQRLLDRIDGSTDEASVTVVAGQLITRGSGEISCVPS